MGNNKSKSSKKESLSKFELEIVVTQISEHANLNMNRQIGELKQREIDLRDRMSSTLFSYDEINIEFITIVNLFKNIKVSKFLIKYCQLIKGNSIMICDSQKQDNFDLLEKQKPYLEAIIYCQDKMKIKQIEDFSRLIQKYFGSDVLLILKKFQNLDKNFEGCFNKNPEPNQEEIKDYMRKFLDRYNLRMKDLDGYNKTNQDKNYKDVELDDYLNKLSDLKNIESEYKKVFISKNEYQPAPAKNNDIPSDNNFKIDFDVSDD
jgi:hypothetical protein